jgi:hypothetical protein
MFRQFETICKFALLFTQSSVVLLLFAQFRGSVQQLLEVSLVSLALEKVNFG